MADIKLNGETMRIKRHNDKAEQPSKRHIARLAFLLAGVLIILTAMSLLFVGLIASRKADKQASANQQRLLNLALENKFALVMRDQLSLARCDVSVRRLSHDFAEILS